MVVKPENAAGKAGPRKGAKPRKTAKHSTVKSRQSAWNVKHETDLRRAAERAIMENLTVPIPVGGKALGMGRNKSYEAAKTGELQCVGTGKKRAAITAPIRQRLGLENHATA